MRNWPGILVIIAALVGLVTFTACGGKAKYEVGQISGSYKILHVPYHGSYVACIRMHNSSGQEQWGGLSCDWVEYHNRVDHQ